MQPHLLGDHGPGLGPALRGPHLLGAVEPKHLAGIVRVHHQDPASSGVVSVKGSVFAAEALAQPGVIKCVLCVAKLGYERDQSSVTGREQVPEGIGTRIECRHLVSLPVCHPSARRGGPFHLALELFPNLGNLLGGPHLLWAVEADNFACVVVVDEQHPVPTRFVPVELGELPPQPVRELGVIERRIGIAKLGYVGDQSTIVG